MNVDASTKPSHKCYHAWLDGKFQEHVLAADEERGYIIKAVLNDEDVVRQYIEGEVRIIDTDMLPVPAKRTLRVMVMEGATPSKFSRMLIEHFRACGHRAEIIEVTPELKGYRPDAVWIDDIEESFNAAARAAMRRIEQQVLYGLLPQGLLRGTWQRGVVKLHEKPPTFASGQERKWWQPKGSS